MARINNNVYQLAERVDAKKSKGLLILTLITDKKHFDKHIAIQQRLEVSF